MKCIVDTCSGEATDQVDFPLFCETCAAKVRAKTTAVVSATSARWDGELRECELCSFQWLAKDPSDEWECPNCHGNVCAMCHEPLHRNDRALCMDCIESDRVLVRLELTSGKMHR